MPKRTRLPTGRLLLRSWRHDDVAAYEAACNTSAVMRWLGGLQSRFQVAQEVEYFQKAELRDGFTFWVVERIADGQFVGFCGLLRIRERDCPFRNSVEIGWRMRESEWRNGYAFEAATRAMECAFETLELAQIVSRAAAGNKPSWKLMRKLGMKRRRELDYVPRDERRKLVVYSITAEQWRRRLKGESST